MKTQSIDSRQNAPRELTGRLRPILFDRVANRDEMPGEPGAARGFSPHAAATLTPSLEPFGYAIVADDAASICIFYTFANLRSLALFRVEECSDRFDCDRRLRAI